MYPPIETFDHGLLPVGHGNTIYWEASGSPNGKPALYLHGGPGSGLGKGGSSPASPGEQLWLWPTLRLILIVLEKSFSPL